MKTECVELAKQPGEVNDVIPLIGENPDQHSNNGCNVVLIEFFRILLHGVVARRN